MSIRRNSQVGDMVEFVCDGWWFIRGQRAIIRNIDWERGQVDLDGRILPTCDDRFVPIENTPGTFGVACLRDE